MSDCHEQVLELLDRSGAALFALSTRLTLREDVAEELMQDLFVRLTNAPNRVSVEYLEAYARRVAINLAFDWRRRHRRRRRVALESASEPISSSRGPLGEAIAAEELQLILTAVGRLKGLCREAFVMRYIEQDSYEAIAEQLGKTPHQARALCFRAMRRLRAALGGRDLALPGKGLLYVENE